jgi:calcium-dependent protein kinase
VPELKAALAGASMNFDEQEIDRIINEVDYQRNNKINYSEFLAATLSISKILTNERLTAMFKQFDSDGSGYITPEDIAEAMHKLGQKISNAEIEDIMSKHDLKKEGRISFEEFKLIFLEIQ